MSRKLLILSILSLLSSAVFAQTNTFSPEINRVAVFKNGYAFTYREGEGTVRDGWIYTTNAPIGVLGTVWGFSSSPNVRVDQLLASEVSGASSVRVEDIAELLLANEGKRIRVVDQNNADKVYEGTYEIVSRFRSFKNEVKTENGYRPPATFDLNLITLSLKTESGILLLPASSVRKLEILDPQPIMQKPKVEKQVQLGIKTSGAKDGEKVKVGVAALERGIRWIPAYRVEVKGDPIKEAKLELEANVVNDLADLKNTEINFVVGVPHFLFQDTASPLSINTAFAGVSSNLGRAATERRYSNAIQSQVADSNYLEADDVSPTVAEEEKTASFSAEQLYLYQTNLLNLKKGERATLRLFSLTVPCTEVFEWTINDVNDAHQRYLNPGYSGQSNLNSLQDLSTRIWYALELKNTTGMPWTTAPAISFRDWKPLGQDLMKFTGIGGEEVLRVTPATEVLGSHTLEEVERTQQRIRWSGSEYDFDKVTVEGTIKLRNVKKQSVDLVLTRNVVGHVSVASDEGKITKSGLDLQSVNSNSVIKWNVKVPSGEKELKYTYTVFVRK